MKKWQIRGGAAASLLAVMAAAGCLAAPVYYLNDDTTIRYILSGACTGIPDSHAVQMGYPLTWLLAALYRLAGKLRIFVPWFDLFMAGCILLAGMGILMGCREIAGEKKTFWRLVLILTGTAFFMGMFLPNYLYMHYTIVAAMLAGSALFLWGSGHGRGLPLCLLGLCYLVRTEVFLLAMPFLLVAALDGLLREAGSREKGRGWMERLRPALKRQWRPLLVLALMAAVFWGINRVGYGSQDWQKYWQYFDNRVKLYDYTDFPSTDRYGEYYEQLGLDWGQYQVLFHYDTILDQSIDEQVLEQVKSGINGLKENVPTGQRVRQCLREYYLHMRYDGTTYGLLWAGCCGLLLILLTAYRRWDKLLLLAALELGRSMIWLFLIARGRFPERIWITLYLIETGLLLGMLLRECVDCDGMQAVGGKKWFPVTAMILCLALAGSVVPMQLRHTAQRVAQQQVKQDQWNLLADSLDQQYLYLMDVYSAVAYAGEVYGRDDGHILLLGGWLAQSPLVRQRLAAYGAGDGAQALRHEQVRLLVEGSRDVAWLEEYLRQRLGAVKLQAQESIACGENLEFVVYRLVEQDA